MGNERSSYDDAIETLGEVISHAGGQGYDALGDVQDEVASLRQQLAGAVSLTDAEASEVEWALRLHLDNWVSPDRKAQAAARRAYRKIRDRLGGQ